MCIFWLIRVKNGTQIDEQILFRMYRKEYLNNACDDDMTGIAKATKRDKFEEQITERAECMETAQC